MSRLCGAFSWRGNAADGFPQRTATAGPFALGIGESVLFLSVWAGSFRAGVIVDPFTSRCFLDGAAVRCLARFLRLTFCSLVLGVLGAWFALAAAMTWRRGPGPRGVAGVPGASRSPRRRAVRVAGAAPAARALLGCAGA